MDDIKTLLSKAPPNFRVRMTEFNPIEVIKKEETAVIKFIRPEIKNPLSVSTLLLLKESFDSLNRNKKIKTIIFTGSGNTFAAGANLEEVTKLNPHTAVTFGKRGQNLMQTIYHSKKKTIAAIDGFCMGGALDLALSCKMRIASVRSYFAHPGAKLGIITGWSGTQIIPRLIGRKRSLEIFLNARRINAGEALKIGLIDEISDNPLAKSIEISTK
jgi:enoyl-CoA hydratase